MTHLYKLYKTLKCAKIQYDYIHSKTTNPAYNSNPFIHTLISDKKSPFKKSICVRLVKIDILIYNKKQQQPPKKKMHDFKENKFIRLQCITIRSNFFENSGTESYK